MEGVSDVFDAQPVQTADETPVTAPRVRLDAACAAAVEMAHAAAVDVGGASVGDHLGVRTEAERVVTHAFAATVPGYPGWYWAVTVARAPRIRTVTVDEVVLLPGEDALLAPAWLPWSDRLRSGDLGPGDVLMPSSDDPRLVPAYADTDEPSVHAVGFELGLGRPRVMSREGRLDAAERWFTGDVGPDTAMARNAPARCGTCGFYLPLEGALRAAFGVCGNDVAPADGRVVSAEYGCGAHSEAVITAAGFARPTGAVYDNGEVFEPV
jgi:Protein of unknown function (DUF3027)